MRHRRDIPDNATGRARSLRRNMTGPEKRLWALLRDRRLAGLKFRRQVPIGRYIADFYCAEVELIVEVDGESHAERGEYDKRRQEWLESQGHTVLRVSNDDVLESDVEPVLLAILKAAGTAEDAEGSLDTQQRPPHPATASPPSPPHSPRHVFDADCGGEG